MQTPRLRAPHAGGCTGPGLRPSAPRGSPLVNAPGSAPHWAGLAFVSALPILPFPFPRNSRAVREAAPNLARNHGSEQDQLSRLAPPAPALGTPDLQQPCRGRRHGPVGARLCLMWKYSALGGTCLGRAARVPQSLGLSSVLSQVFSFSFSELLDPNLL